MTDTRKMKSNRTQTTYTVGRTTSLALAAQGMGWQTVCDTHGTVQPLGTRSSARAAVNDPDKWCSGCKTAPGHAHGGYRPGSGRKGLAGGSVAVVARVEQVNNEKRPARAFTITSAHAAMIDQWARARTDGNASAAVREMLGTAYRVTFVERDSQNGQRLGSTSAAESVGAGS